uniref:C2H2-type domain-containing protein n=1 Tax=Anopheles epiroticus TaxID=199890 RepID=A0A182PHG0_9DIPT
MIALDEHRPLLDATIGTFLEDITFRVPDNVRSLLPSSVCVACLEVMEFFSKYRRKMKHLHEFLIALARVKLGDEMSLRELFENRTEHLELLFRDLGLCNTTEAGVEDLLQEYEQYMIASIKVDCEENAEMATCEESIAVLELTPLDEVIPLEESEVLEETFATEEQFDSDYTPIEGIEAKETVPTTQRQKRKRKIIQTRQSSRMTVELELDTQDDNATVSDEQQKDDDGVPCRERYQCEICPYKSYHTVAFTLHKKKHEQNIGKSGFVCNNPYCLRMFDTLDELLNHKSSNPHRRYTCEICGNVLKHRVSLEVHMERHVGFTHFQCPYCSSSFHTRTEVKNHLAAIHISEDRAECGECGAVFTSKKLLKQHLESHTEERNFHCKDCERSFKTQHHLNRHIRAVHTEVTRFHCEHCDVSYSRRDKLRMHVEKVHEIQTYFVCDICVRSFDTNEALQEHRHHHEHPQKLECGTCLIVCLTQESFDTHTCITYQDNYVCCGRDFKYHMLYNKHMMSHGIKVNARVKPNTNLLIGQERAMRAGSQSGKKQPTRRKDQTKTGKHECLVCGKSFASITELKQHECDGLG